MQQVNETPFVLTVCFQCQHAPDFKINIELQDCNRVQGLKEAWDAAIQHYCPNQVVKLRKQLKRKLGAVYNFDDQQNVTLRFKPLIGKTDTIRVFTNYTEI